MICNGLMQEVAEETMSGKGGTGRPRISMLNILFGKEMYGTMKLRVEDRLACTSWTPRTCLTAEY